MEKIMDKVTEEVLNAIENKDIKQIVIEHKEPRTVEQELAVETIKKIKNPFRMIGVETIMKDLNICKGIAYKLFQREDFPAINIGKTKQVMLISYLLWKMTRKEW